MSIYCSVYSLPLLNFHKFSLQPTLNIRGAPEAFAAFGIEELGFQIAGASAPVGRRRGKSGAKAKQPVGLDCCSLRLLAFLGGNTYLVGLMVNPLETRAKSLRVQRSVEFRSRCGVKSIGFVICLFC